MKAIRQTILGLCYVIAYVIIGSSLLFLVVGGPILASIPFNPWMLLLGIPGLIFVGYIVGDYYLVR